MDNTINTEIEYPLPKLRGLQDFRSGLANVVNEMSTLFKIEQHGCLNKPYTRYNRFRHCMFLLEAISTGSSERDFRQVRPPENYPVKFLSQYMLNKDISLRALQYLNNNEVA